MKRQSILVLIQALSIAVHGVCECASADPVAASVQGLGDLPGSNFFSDDLTIVGNGMNPSGFGEAWIAALPEPKVVPLPARLSSAASASVWPVGDCADVRNRNHEAIIR